MNYILLGPEEGQKSDWLENEKKRVLKEHPDAEIFQIYVGDDKGDDLDAALSQPSLFSSFRFVIIKQLFQFVSLFPQILHGLLQILVAAPSRSTVHIDDRLVLSWSVLV